MDLCDEAENVDVKERYEQNLITILVATDIHLGYGERNAIIAEDTFITFEEILKLAKSEKVDFLLLGGDLFHDTRPSSYALNKCIELLKRYCLGDRQIQIEFLSDGAFNFSSTINDTVNYEDPNLNVELPIFSIHGNHDDPTGVQQISALNILSSTGLVNYFGRYNSYINIDVEPILLKKGQTQIALYGLSHIKDERLARLFLEKKVNFLIPADSDDWFHLFVLHQNRANRGAKSFIPDDALPKFLNLVIWGHEHDCRIDPEENDNNVFISQPGSTVATSLSVGESFQKHVGLLKIHKKDFILKAIPLKTVRPFVFDEMLLGDLTDSDIELRSKELSDHQEIAKRVVGKKIDEMIEKAKALGREGNMLPLIRLNVSYNNETHAFNPIRFGEAYVEKVANPSDMLKVKCAARKEITRKDKNPVFLKEDLPCRVEDLVSDYFAENSSEGLQFLPFTLINEAVTKSIESNEDILENVINGVVEDRLKQLEAGSIEVEKVKEYLASLLDQNDSSLVDEILKQGSSGKKGKNSSVRNVVSGDSSDETDQFPPKEIPKKGSRSRGGRGSGGRRGSPRGKGRAKATNS